jgi:hypothetical protein
VVTTANVNEGWRAKEGARMARIRKGKSQGPVAVRNLATKKKRSGVHSEARNGEPCTVQRIIEFPMPPAPDEVVSDRVIFEVGSDRFAIKWTAEIERLPPAGPVAVQRKSRLSSDRSSQVGR